MLKVQKAVRVQLKSYCMGMKELISLKKYKKSSEDDEEERQLIERMKATVGAAVSQMECHIQAGTICCPTTEPDAKVQSTPKQQNTARRRSTTSTVSSTRQSILLDSTEKDIVSSNSAVNNEESFCCSGEYCWKKDDPKNFTVKCSVCNLMCHEYCSKLNDSTKYSSCDQCAHK